MTRINTNVSSLNAQKTLNRSNSQLQLALTRLSTGLRINTGKDDPAGLIASEVLRSDIVSVERAVANSERANQLISTADAALGQVSSLLNDIRALVSEAANTGALSSEQIAANQLQIDSSLEAIDRISQITSFQGRKLLDGSLDFITSGTNAAFIKDLKIDQATFGTRNRVNVSLDVVSQATRGTLNYNFGALADDVVLEVSGRNGTEVFNFAQGSTIGEVATAVNLVSDATGVEAVLGSGATAGELTISSYGGNNDIILTAKNTGFDAGNIRVNYSKGNSSGTTVDFTQGTGGQPSLIDVKLKTTEGVHATGIANDDKAASLTTSTGSTDPNSEFKLTAKQTGTAGNNIRLVVATQDNQGQGVEVAVTENGTNTDITVTLDTDAANGGANAKLTANDLIAAINGHVDASDLVTATLTATSNGSGTLNTLAATALSGGSDVANNALEITSRIAGEDFSDVSVHFVDGDKIQVKAFAATDIYLDYQNGPVKARAALDLGGAGDDILITAKQAGTAFNDVKIRFVSSVGLGNNANATYNAADKELVLEVDSANATTVGALINAINDEGTFEVTADTSDGETLNLAQTITTISVTSLTENTGKSGSDGKTLFVYFDAANTAADVISELAAPGTNQFSRRVDALFDIRLAQNNTGAGLLSELALDKVVKGGVTAGKILATANDVVSAINSSAAGQFVAAALAPGNNGFGVVSEFEKFAFSGTAEANNRLQFLAPAIAPKIRFVANPGQSLGLDLTTAPKVEGFASVAIHGSNANASLVFTAKQKGGEFDGFEVVFKADNDLVDAAGDEKVQLDFSKKRLTVLFRSGASTANHVISALAADEFASKFFEAENFGSSTGAGLILASDTDLNNEDLNLTTSGGLIDPGTLIIKLQTDANGTVKTTANDLISFLDDPSKFVSDASELATVKAALDEYGISAANIDGSNGTGLLQATTADIVFGDLGVTFSDQKATGRTVAVNGTNAQLEFTAVTSGAAFDGVKVRFVNNESITRGNEHGSYDANTKTLTFEIDEGQTTAADIFNIFVSSHANYDASLAALFSSRLLGTGASLVTLDDTATLTGGRVQTSSADGAALLGNADADTNTLQFRATEFGSAAFVQVKALSGTFELRDSSGAVSTRSVGRDVVARINGIQAVGFGLRSLINTSGLDIALTLDENVADGTKFNFNIDGGGAQFQLGPEVVSNQQARLGIQAINTARLGGASGRLFELRSGGAKSLANDVTAAARVVEEAITQVVELRGRLGAFQKTTLETNIFSLNDALENLSEAQSSIRDADFAVESARLTRAQILVQSGNAVLAIANQNPQNALALLR
jgi:flagellin-like hook-associated protein FlgL